MYEKDPSWKTMRFGARYILSLLCRAFHNQVSTWNIFWTNSKIEKRQNALCRAQKWKYAEKMSPQKYYTHVLASFDIWICSKVTWGGYLLPFKTTSIMLFTTLWAWWGFKIKPCTGYNLEEIWAEKRNISAKKKNKRFPDLLKTKGSAHPIQRQFHASKR